MSIDETIRTDLSWHLRDNWAPVLDERTDFDLRVEGTIPSEAPGTYMRTGPNPAVRSPPHHWFFGDGMVHGVRIAAARPERYRNRFVQTPNITNPAGDAMSNMGDLTRGTGNTQHPPAQRASSSVSKKATGPGRSTANSTPSATRTSAGHSPAR